MIKHWHMLSYKTNVGPQYLRAQQTYDGLKAIIRTTIYMVLSLLQCM